MVLKPLAFFSCMQKMERVYMKNRYNDSMICVQHIQYTHRGHVYCLDDECHPVFRGRISVDITVLQQLQEQLTKSAKVRPWDGGFRGKREQKWNETRFRTGFLQDILRRFLMCLFLAPSP